MTEPKVIQVTVDPAGAVTVKTVGFAGTSCKEASRYLEEALGVRGQESFTPEYFQGVETSDRLQQGR